MSQPKDLTTAAQPTPKSGNVHSFKGVPPGPFNMQDDQKTAVHLAPENSQGQPTALATGTAVAWSLTDSTTPPPATLATIDNSADPSGLNPVVVGAKGFPGNVTITGTYSNADGTAATPVVIGPFAITVDPAELDVSQFNVTVDPPVAQ